MQKVDLKSMTFAELQQFVEDLGEKKFRTTQLYQWMHQKMVKEFASMTNLSAAFRDKLEEQAALNGCTMVKRQISADGTNKFLMELSDGNKVESVLMKYHHGNSVCISTQVGCRMGCRFCASTVGGLNRSLTTGEMLEQIYEVQRITGERVSNVILMGIGEPLDNYENEAALSIFSASAAGKPSMRSNSSASVIPNVPGASSVIFSSVISPPAMANFSSSS